MDFDIDIDGWPADVEWDALTVRAHAALGTVEPALHNPRLTASVLFTSDADVHALNKEWRGKDRGCRWKRMRRTCSYTVCYTLPGTITSIRTRRPRQWRRWKSQRLQNWVSATHMGTAIDWSTLVGPCPILHHPRETRRVAAG